MLSVMINTKDLTEYDMIENAMTFTVRISCHLTDQSVC